MGLGKTSKLGLIPISFATNPSFSATANSGPSGTTLTFTGSDFTPSTFYEIYFDTPAEHASQSFGDFLTDFASDSSGNVPASVTGTIPGAPAGSYYIDVYQGASLVASTAFTVTQAETLSISTPASAQGPVDTTVTLTGSGYAPGASYDVWFDTTVGALSEYVISFTADGSGNIPADTIFSVPAYVPGTYYVDASYDYYADEFLAGASFQIIGGETLSVSTAAGPDGTVVALTGSGYAASPNYGISVYFDSTSGTEGVYLGSFTPDASGNIPASTTVVVPAIGSGSYYIETFFNDYNTVLLASQSFSVSAKETLSLSMYTGPDATAVTLTGSNYATDDSTNAYTVYVDQTPGTPYQYLGSFYAVNGGMNAGDIPADTVVTIPGLPTGTFYIDVYFEDSGTQLLASQEFTVIGGETLTINPSTGPSGTVVTLSGSNYAASASIYVYLDTTPGSAGIYLGNFVTDGSGNIPASTSVTIPGMPAGEYYLETYYVNDFYQVLASEPFKVTAAETLSLSTNAGPLGTVVTITGSNYAPNSVVGVYLDLTPGSANYYLGDFTADGSGNIPASTTITIPAVDSGNYYIDTIYVDVNYELLASQSFTVTPLGASVSVNPTSGPAGTSMTVTGSGYTDNTAYNIYLDQTAGTPEYYMGSFTSDGSGNIPALTLATIPGVASGSYYVDVFYDNVLVASTSFTVTATESFSISPGTGPAGDSIAETGSNYAPGATYNVYFDETSGVQYASMNQFTADGSGNIPGGTAGNVPGVVAGSYYVEVFYGNQLIASKPFTVTASETLLLSSGSGPVGSGVGLSGSNYGPNAQYQVCFDQISGTPYYCVGDLTTDDSGNIAAATSFNVPQVPLGSYYIEVFYGGELLASQPFMVTSASATTSTTTATTVTTITSPTVTSTATASTITTTQTTVTATSTSTTTSTASQTSTSTVSSTTTVPTTVTTGVCYDPTVTNTVTSTTTVPTTVTATTTETFTTTNTNSQTSVATSTVVTTETTVVTVTSTGTAVSSTTECSTTETPTTTTTTTVTLTSPTVTNTQTASTTVTTPVTTTTTTTLTSPSTTTATSTGYTTSTITSPTTIASGTCYDPTETATSTSTVFVPTTTTETATSTYTTTLSNTQTETVTTTSVTTITTGVTSTSVQTVISSTTVCSTTVTPTTTIATTTTSTLTSPTVTTTQTASTTVSTPVTTTTTTTVTSPSTATSTSTSYTTSTTTSPTTIVSGTCYDPDETSTVTSTVIVPTTTTETTTQTYATTLSNTQTEIVTTTSVTTVTSDVTSTSLQTVLSSTTVCGTTVTTSSTPTTATSSSKTSPVQGVPEFPTSGLTSLLLFAAIFPLILLTRLVGANPSKKRVT